MVMKITFYYVRHGRTEYNKAGIIQGQVDSPLCLESIHVLEDTREALRDVNITQCYTSPYRRAVDTARIVLGDRDIPLVPLDNLKEISFGDIDGKRHVEHGRELFIGHLTDNFRFIHGESASDVKARARKAFNRMIASANDGDNILIACHGSYYRYMLYELLGKNRLTMKFDPRYYGIPNGAVSIISYEDGTFKLLCYPLNAKELTEFLVNRY